MKFSWRITGISAVRVGPWPSRSSTSIVTSLMLGPTDDPCQRPVSSHSTFSSDRPARLTMSTARSFSGIAATLRTTAA